MKQIKGRDYKFREGEVLLIDKPLEWTSFDVVNHMRSFIRRNTHMDRFKIGHAGTLDPLASGLLIICTGKFTKKIDTYQGLIKEYCGSIQLGATTPTYDLETEVNEVFDTSNITTQEIEKARDTFIGTIKQVPPIYSAVKIDGKRAYMYARKDEEVIMKTKEITIHEFELPRIEIPQVDFRVVCSKGTYIRSLAYDLGRALNNGAHLTALRRTKIGDFSVNQAYTLEEFRESLLDYCSRNPNTEND